MTLREIVGALDWFLALYPALLAAVWVAGGLVFRLLDEDACPSPPEWPGVTMLVPAHNEEPVIATCVRAALAVDYPALEILVLDDGSTDATVEAATAAAAGDPRVQVIRDPVNRGKAERLNLGFGRARHQLVAVVDADTHLHPTALRLLVARISSSPRTAAVAGAPHVTNRRNLLAAMQVLEAASIIGLVRRTQALAGHVGVVAGVLGLFRREAVIEVGGYDPRMATEDIDLSWRLLLAGWHTAYEPRALIGMEVPTSLGALWKQRLRWARGQGEVLHLYVGRLAQLRHRWLWPLAFEAVASLLWVLALAFVLLVHALALFVPSADDVGGIGIAWGVAVAVVAAVQVAFALALEARYDRLAVLTFLLAPLYVVAFWVVNAAVAIRSETVGIARGPSGRGVVWDIPRERSSHRDESPAPGGD